MNCQYSIRRPDGSLAQSTAASKRRDRSESGARQRPKKFVPNLLINYRIGPSLTQVGHGSAIVQCKLGGPGFRIRLVNAADEVRKSANQLHREWLTARRTGG
jgi:hypothetical protein